MIGESTSTGLKLVHKMHPKNSQHWYGEAQPRLVSVTTIMMLWLFTATPEVMMREDMLVMCAEVERDVMNPNAHFLKLCAQPMMDKEMLKSLSTQEWTAWESLQLSKRDKHSHFLSVQLHFLILIFLCSKLETQILIQLLRTAEPPTELKSQLEKLQAQSRTWESRRSNKRPTSDSIWQEHSIQTFH